MKTQTAVKMLTDRFWRRSTKSSDFILSRLLRLYSSLGRFCSPLLCFGCFCLPIGRRLRVVYLGYRFLPSLIINRLAAFVNFFVFRRFNLVNGVVLGLIR